MWSISQATGVRLNLLMAANPQITDPAALKPGMIVAVPELNKSGLKAGQKQPGKNLSMGDHSHVGLVHEYTTSPTDTWEGIAKKYGVKVEQLHHINGTHGKPMRPGKKLYIPDMSHSSQSIGQSPAGPVSTSGMSSLAVKPSSKLPQVPSGPHQHSPVRSQDDPLLDVAWSHEEESQHD